MSARRIRNFLVIAAIAALGYWIWKDRPTLSGIVDTLTAPLFGSDAAVKGSERKRVVGEATEIISTQEEARVGMLREGMRREEVRDLIGSPTTQTTFRDEEKILTRWSYPALRRELVFDVEGRLISIAVK